MPDLATPIPRALLDNVSGIVLAGTYHWTGTRFEALGPRPLLPIAHKPIIEYALDWLEHSGIQEAILCANGSTKALQRHFAGAPRRPLAVGFHEDGSPRGAAGCVKDAAARSEASTFIVTDGSSIPTVDIAALLEHHGQSGAGITIVVHPKPFSGDKPQLTPTGTYVFSRDVLDHVPATSFQDIKENLIPRLHRQGCRISLFEVGELAPHLRGFGGYLSLNRWMIERIVGAASGNSSEVVAHPTAWIDGRATIIGPVIIGPGAQVHEAATIVGPTCIGARTRVEPGAVIARSVTWEECTVAEGATVDQCVLSNRSVVEAQSHVSRAVVTPTAPRRPWLSLPLLLRRPAAGTSGEVARPALS